jgi:hypothetical protein
MVLNGMLVDPAQQVVSSIQSSIQELLPNQPNRVKSDNLAIGAIGSLNNISRVFVGSGIIKDISQGVPSGVGIDNDRGQIPFKLDFLRIG